MRKLMAGIALATTLTFAPALDAVHAQDATTEDDDDSGNLGLLGLVGLLGLAGLAGLKRRDTRYDSRRDTTVTGTGI